LKVDNAEVLRSWMTLNSSAERFLASTYLPGRNLACTMLYYDGAFCRAACAERVRYVMSRVAPSGITGNTSFGRLLHDPELVRTAASAMDHLFSRSGSARHGVITVDLKEDGHGRAFVTEVNVRHVAFVQCFAAAGANLPQDAIRLVDGDPGFDRSFLAYDFEGDPVFLRDVDALPVLIGAGRLLD
jgi:carbamoyl-phosphate synthase large subunit